MTEVCYGDGLGKIRSLRWKARQVLLWGVVGRDVSVLWTALATLESQGGVVGLSRYSHDFFLIHN